MSTEETGLSQALEAALHDVPSTAEGTSTVEAECNGVHVQATVRDIDRLGIVIERVRVQSGTGNLGQRTLTLADIRPAGERLRAVEVAPSLGGSKIRTRTEDIRNGEFFEIDVAAEGAELRRYRKTESGQRVITPFTVTRKHLGNLVDQIAEALDD